ncbi:hypothetical protein TTHERM_000854319 (macronuclear) [Tetrahymena thermophila SB210]|uniref:Uncharacterized protein n=1 Tax=Tetrahymena thermophila (strain SB210) TaxID=312017 RepID=W7XIH7_TETTS|nr:hypothetical protein TTHERM_000854319 [Tetrahymena thermophila SB210]EWS74666.1 hypothetical protein TTHERM_000854319 [Tetrahymena thermophila SB210]|eukprot:XP_012652792.1 hypothetical protein TTHERM_000854319 [Tetrahymena thermophila SB210]
MVLLLFNQIQAFIQANLKVGLKYVFFYLEEDNQTKNKYQRNNNESNKTVPQKSST